MNIDGDYINLIKPKEMRIANTFRKNMENSGVKCALCRKNFNKTNKFLNLKLKDEKDHLFCENCAKEKKININEEKKNDNLIEFFCKFCESKHYIKSWEIAEESNCIVF